MVILSRPLFSTAVLFIAAVFPSTICSQTTRYEAEFGQAVCQGSIDSNHSGYSGQGFCNSPILDGVAVHFVIASTRDGSADLAIRYANGNAVGRPANIFINGMIVQTEFAFDGTGGWDQWATRTFTAPVKAGSNTIKIVAAFGSLANIDYLDFGLAQLPARPMENLGRGVVALRSSSTSVLITWRLLGLDPDDIGFNVYRATGGGGAAVRLNSNILTKGTNFLDSTANLSQANTYHIRPVVGGSERAASKTFTLLANNAVEPIIRIPVRATGAIKFVWVGDLDGDGEYDYVLDRQTSPQKLEAYRSDGTFLWDVDMGPNSVNQDNIEPGSSTIDVGHWDGVTVYDFDSDGKAEVAVRISNGVRFGDGKTFRSSNNSLQFIAVIDGLTGALRASAPVPTDYIADGPLAARFGVGYLDGSRPHLVAYMKNRIGNTGFNLMMSAWTFDGNAVKMEWKWLRGNQNAPDGHNTRIIDVDGDGRDEVHEIGFTLNGDGNLRYLMGPKGINHGDRFHVAKMDPGRAGLQGYAVQQDNPNLLYEYCYDARDGSILWQHFGTQVGDVGRGMAGDIDPRYPGMEVWSFSGLYNAKTNQLTEPNTSLRPWPHLGLWWDGDTLLELYNDGKFEKWNWSDPRPTNSLPRILTIGNYGAVNTHSANPGFIGDILGDWREEVIVTNAANDQLIIFSTDIPSDVRLYTLAHNPAYRNAMTLKGYVQSHHLDYFLGADMSQPPRPNIRYAST
jgi:rhamnogalacturonan endolyase